MTVVNARPVRDGLTVLERYQPRFGVRPNNIISLEKAEGRYGKNQSFVLLFGDEAAPDYYIETHGTGRFGMNICFLDGKDVAKRYVLACDAPGVTDQILIAEYLSPERNDAGWRANFFITGAIKGDLPSVNFNREIWYSISVPWQDFLLPVPSFDAILDGSFVGGLPHIPMPPESLLVDYVDARDLTPETVRTPVGRFPWG